MAKHYTDEQKRLAVIMFKMQSCVEHYLKDLAVMYPEVTEISGFASLEIKRTMYLVYLNAVMQTESAKDLNNFFEVLIYSVHKAMTDDELQKNTTPPTMDFN